MRRTAKPISRPTGTTPTSIAVGEVGITPLEEGRLLTVPPLDAHARASWHPDGYHEDAQTSNGSDEGSGYALRVHAPGGAFDETQIRRLDLSRAASADAAPSTLPEVIELDLVDPGVAPQNVPPEISGRDMTHWHTIRAGATSSSARSG